jgi:hypothetical protein
MDYFSHAAQRVIVGKLKTGPQPFEVYDGVGHMSNASAVVGNVRNLASARAPALLPADGKGQG